MLTGCKLRHSRGPRHRGLCACKALAASGARPLSKVSCVFPRVSVEVLAKASLLVNIALASFGSRPPSKMDWFGCGCMPFFVRARRFSHGVLFQGASVPAKHWLPISHRSFCYEGNLA
eukprot:1159586-Pelagomonas_calceolata.AAC.3